jgi:hypothetical protein
MVKEMKVQITQYEREDGVTMFRCHDRDGWIIRSILGPAWFWDPNLNVWVVVSAYATDYFSRCCVTEKQGLKLLETIQKKS